MKTRRWTGLALMLAAMLLLTPVYATNTATDLLQDFGMSESEAEAFVDLAKNLKGDVTEADIREMLSEFTGDGTGQQLPGQLVDGTYTDPEGYSLKVPEGWTLQEEQIGSAVVLTAPVTDKGFMPTITILVVTAPEDDFLKKTQEEIDVLLSQSLQNYLPIALDDFEFLDIPAREMVCMYGENEESMLMQYQLHFNTKSKAFIITMTTLAEEAEHEQTLDTYDTFLAEFVLLDGAGNG